LHVIKNKCHPFFLYAIPVVTTPAVPFALTIEIDSKIPGPEDSIREYHSGCIDGWRGDNCDEEIQPEVESQPERSQISISKMILVLITIFQ
jgi:hypothetical protein